MALAAIMACQVGNLFACRSEWASVVRLRRHQNPLLWAGLGVEIAALLAFIYVPALSWVFATHPPAAWQWALLVLCPVLLLGAEELRKRRQRPLLRQ